MVGNNSFNLRLERTIITIFLVLLAMLCVAPVLYVLAVSLSDRVAVEAGKVSFWPVGFTLEAYNQILQDERFFTSFMVTIKRCILGGTIDFLVMVSMAFPLSRTNRQFPARPFYITVMIICMLFNGGMIPTFLVVNKLKLIDTIWALVLPGSVKIFNIILLMNFFKGIPASLEEAAIIDGASPFTILTKVFLPLSKPAIATVMLFSLLGHWNGFMDGILYMNKPENFPLQTYIYQLSRSIDYNYLATLPAEEAARLLEVCNTTFNSAKVFVCMIPVLIVYPFAQKYFTKGLVMGSVKG